MSELDDVAAVVLSVAVEFHGETDNDHPLIVRVKPPTDKFRLGPSEIDVHFNAKQALFLAGFMSDIIPEIQKALAEQIETTGGVCDCPDCVGMMARDKSRRFLLN